MKHESNTNSSTQYLRRGACAVVVLGALAWSVGCGKPDRDASTPAKPTPDVRTPTALSEAITIPEGAPVLDETYPNLVSAALVHARLIVLPEGVLLQAPGIAISKADLEEEVRSMPQQMQDQARKNAIFLLEQMATRELLLSEARRQGDTGAGTDQAVIQAYVRRLADGTRVGDDEIAEFYNENRDLVGDAPLERIAPRIRQHLLQEKQQQAVEEHIRGMGKTMPIAVSASWAGEQAQTARDNPVDRARNNGNPTFVSFGADTCIPCQKMAPTRETIRQRYGDRLNVVYVHVGKEQMLASRFGVQGIPYLIFYDADGRETHRQAGLMTEEQIEAQLRKAGVEEPST